MATSQIKDLKDELARLQQRLLAVESSVAITREEARHYDRLKTFETLTRSVVHKLGTALNIVTGYAHIIQETPAQPEEVTEMASAIHQQADGITQLIRRLIQFSAAGAPESTICNLSAITKEMCDLFSDFAKSRGVVLTYSYFSTEAKVLGEPRLLGQAIAAMLRCILEKMPKGSLIVDLKDKGREAPTSQSELRECVILSITLKASSARTSNEFLDPELAHRTNSILYPEIRGLGVSKDLVQDCGGWITIDWLCPQGPTILTYFPKQAPV